MKPDKPAPKTIDDYISVFPEDVQEILEKLRQLIKHSAPDAQESISYQMPAFKLAGKPLVYFAAFKTHIGLYPTPDGIGQFKDELAVYKNAKGSVQFPLTKPIPYELIGKIVAFRVQEILVKVKAKK
jgi:uncharacterized protein YdhG (YjbR/CyaY superfamily)